MLACHKNTNAWDDNDREFPAMACYLENTAYLVHEIGGALNIGRVGTQSESFVNHAFRACGASMCSSASL